MQSLLLHSNCQWLPSPLLIGGACPPLLLDDYLIREWGRVLTSLKITSVTAGLVSKTTVSLTTHLHVRVV